MTEESSAGDATDSRSGGAGDQRTRPGGEERASSAGPGAGTGAGAGSQSGGERFSEGWTRGLEFLGSLKDTIEEALGEARQKGDLNVDKARSAMRDAVRKAQEATSDARERFDFATTEEVAELRARIEALEARLGVSGSPSAEDTAGDSDGASEAAGGGSEASAAQADGVP